MNESYAERPSGLQGATRQFACGSAAHAYSIGRLVADLDREKDSLVGADRLTVQALLERLSVDSLALLIWSKRVQQGILPR